MQVILTKSRVGKDGRLQHDVIIISIQGAFSTLLENALAVSTYLFFPIIPKSLVERKFKPKTKLIKIILETLYKHQIVFYPLQTLIPEIKVYTKLPILAKPTRCLEHKKFYGRIKLIIIEIIHDLLQKLFPQYYAKAQELDKGGHMTIKLCKYIRKYIREQEKHDQIQDKLSRREYNNPFEG